MANLKGIKALEKALENLHYTSAIVRETLEEKRDWWNEKSEKWQESDAGQAMDDKLGEIEQFLDDCDNLEINFEIE